MKSVLITAATATQLAQFASINLGLPADYREGVATLIAKIKSTGFEKETIEVEDDTPVKVAPLQAKAIEDAKAPVTVIVSQQEGVGGSDPVFVSVNGSAMLIPRAKPAKIPYHFYEALKNAVRAVYDPLPDGGLSEPRDVPQYPFSVVL